MTEPLKLPTAPQTRKILTHLRKVGSISGVEAQFILGVRALPRRISDLEELGYLITRERRTDTQGQRYVRYLLDE